jgi:hypothetical protein
VEHVQRQLLEKVSQLRRRKPNPFRHRLPGHGTGPFVLSAAALTILLTGGLPVAGPVRRALNVDPALLLREQ